MDNYYHILGLSENATPDEIKAAFKKLAVKYHPDKNQGLPEMEEKFKEINHAYQILSDPYEKARYDLKLKYRQFSQAHQATYTYTPNHKRQNPRYYRRTTVDYKKNATATAYAFGITFLIAMVVMSSVWIKTSYDNHKKEERLAERRASFEMAKNEFKKGKYYSAFEIMSQMKFFSTEEKDIRNFKTSMMNEIIDKGDREFAKNNYAGAISLYEMVQSLEPEKPFYGMKKRLAEAYRMTGEAEKALEILNNFLLNEFEHISSLVKIAEIQRDQFNNLEEALDYYQIGHRLAVKRYKAIYGEGYPIVIREQYVHKSHYYLYSGLADIYLRLEDTNMAIKAADWNKYVWPDSTDAYVTTAEALMKQGKINKACNEYRIAREKGWSGVHPLACN